MSNIDDKLNEVLNIADKVLEKKQEKNPLEIINDKPVAPENAEVDTDFDAGRNELYKLLEKGSTAIDGILNLAKEGEHPRAYEVAGQLIKTQSEIAQNLLDLQDKLKRLKDSKGELPKGVTNALFVGSTTELQKLIKKNKDKK
jgi:Mg2+ and Co2+ transporter CorA